MQDGCLLPYSFNVIQCSDMHQKVCFDKWNENSSLGNRSTWYMIPMYLLYTDETIDRGRKFRFWGVTGFSQDSVYISKLVREDRDLFVRSQSILMQIMIYHPLSSPIAEAKAGTAPITEHTAFMSSLSFLQIERLFSFQVCSMSWTYVMSGLYCRWWRRS